MAKKKRTLTLEESVITQAQAYTTNLSATVTDLLRTFIADCEREKLRASLLAYEKEAPKRRKKIGIFSDGVDRKFL